MGYQHQHQHEHEQGMSAGGEGVEDTAFFEYRGKDGNIHGPYGASQMRGWAQQASVWLRRSPLMTLQLDRSAVEYCKQSLRREAESILWASG